MSEDLNQPDDAQAPAAEVPRYQHKVATRVVPMQRDIYGRRFWESHQSPTSYQVRAEAQIPPHLPGIIIFVHGVNSEGEWYDSAEAALCEGLNKRLNRDDIKPNEYSSVDPETQKPTPRRLTKKRNSPVIRFYWGYSAVGGEATQWRVPLRNDRGADFWDSKRSDNRGPWYWGGGAFQNGTNNLQQLWSEKGFKRNIAKVFDMQVFNTEWDRELHDAPPRQYYAHAAQRLANLIDKIRTNCPRDTITLMSHSQGTMIAMAATALCKKRAPDSVVVMNSPFALKDKLTDALLCGNERPTEQARINTFRNIANRIKQDKRVFTEAQMQKLQVGATEDMNFWRPDLKLHYGLPERDNHGRLYVYFNPHDRVMGATPLQSIGWQGVNDKLLAELGDTVKQRMLARGTACGDEPGVKNFGSLPLIPDPEPGVEPTDFWNLNRRALGMHLWAVPDPDQTVTINAEKVPDPITAEEMSIPVMRQVTTAQGSNWMSVYFDESRSTQNELSAKRSDGTYKDPSFPYLRTVYETQNHTMQPDLYASSGKRQQRETEQQLHKRIDEYQPMPTNHSTLPKHHEFMSRVAAYDLPIGFCDAYEKSGGFWQQLMYDADWTSLNDPYYTTGKLDVPAQPSHVDVETVTDEVTQADIKRLKWNGA